ncbi:hypothetical protein Theam_1784 (plasmid) [Thermovibrio ammonificans HB-1]|uniref:Sporulation domain-containing protein n=1 Tax=Thermovibrio ammonificans (strain DSM 15698 / JCM 12110 / HB-1) TaxID=648996 RepID=E8T6R7_THEA1|nr:hypothetical protein [Thermovibrio ammonificans]ADU97740.1 hypothetical protein Theam_1784 [Thermovibrio ammonificans HB-1]
MRKLAAALTIVLSLSASAHAQVQVQKTTVTVRELGEAVHYLIDLYRKNSREIEELRRENKQLRRKLKELEDKLVLIRLEQKVQKAQEKSQSQVQVRKMEMKSHRVPVVEEVPGSQPNEFPWVTFKRSDVTCELPERTSRGYRYLNIFITRSRSKAINLARNVARTGLCTVVRRITKRDEKPLYRVVVIPNGRAEEILKEMGLKYYPYIRNLDLTRSSGGEL